MITEACTVLIEAIRLRREKGSETADELRRKSEAIRQVMDAVVATKAYLYERDQGEERSRAQERELSAKWQDAAMAVRQYDENLYHSAQLKALGWADPREWKRAASRPEAIKLDVIIEQCQWLQGGQRF